MKSLTQRREGAEKKWKYCIFRQQPNCEHGSPGTTTSLKTNRYSIAYRLQTAKNPQTREKRMQAIIGKLARNEKFH
jgi:hypothetical protein